MLLLLAGCWVFPLRAAMITLGADRDASLFKLPADNSNGGGPGIFVGTNGMAQPRRGLIAFDLGAIPAGSTILDVQLTLTVGQAAGGSAMIGLFELTSSWGEGSNAPSTTIAMTGAGQPAQPGDATWNSQFHGTTLWNTPGGDFAAVASSSLAISDVTLNRSHTWLSTPQLVADVQEWLEQPNTNQGWLLKSADETAAASNTVFGFYSSEWSNPTLRPSLQITYTVPEPAVLPLTALALLGARPFRRRRSYAKTA